MGIYHENATRGATESCFASNIATSHGVQYKNSTDVAIRGCLTSKVKGFGANLYGVTRGSVESHHSLDSYLEGVNLLNCHECVVEAPIVGWTGDGAWPSNDFGVSIWGDVTDSIGANSSTYCQIRGGVVSGASQSGVAIVDATTYTKVSGVTVINPNSKNEAAGSGVLLYGSACQNNIIDGITVRATNGLMRYGAAELDYQATGIPSNNIIRNIVSTGHTASTVALSATTAYKTSVMKAPAANTAPLVIESLDASAGRAAMQLTHLANPTLPLTIYKDETGAGVIQNEGAHAMFFATAAATRMYIDSTGQVVALQSLKSTHPTGGIGYMTGAGGTVTQATSKSTGVTINKVCGDVVTHDESMAAGAAVSFTVANSAVEVGDAVYIKRKSGGTALCYYVDIDSVSAGSFVVILQNIDGSSHAEAITLNFMVFKGVTA